LRILKTKLFHRWAKKNQLNDDALIKAINEIEEGLVDVDLGSHIYKKRIATKGKGKSGSVRTVLAYKTKNRAFFLYVFEKKQRDNISEKEIQALKIFGAYLLKLTDRQIDDKIKEGSLLEINNEAGQ